ncbi:MAG: glucokinase [Pseudomonadota bacterium]|jgi:glucokinase
MKADASAVNASFPRLVADIGGTNARFGWLGDASSPVQHVRRLSVMAHAGPAQAVRAYLGEIGHLMGAEPCPPRRAAFAVASSVTGDRIDLTNSHWGFSRAEVQAQLGLDTLQVLNDFEALALSLPRLGSAQLRSFGDRPLPGGPTGTLAAIGPGTGLGVAGVVQTPHGWVALSGEGGHATLSAADGFESDLLAFVRRERPHVSAERLLSGIGLPVLHAAVAAITGTTTPALTAEEIVERGTTGSDPGCARTLDVFCALLGGFAGNVALTLGARGGVYIGGGIVPRLGERFFTSRFRERFEAKGRFRSYLEAIPTLLITDTEAALTGAALAIEQSGR